MLAIVGSQKLRLVTGELDRGSQEKKIHYFITISKLEYMFVYLYREAFLFNAFYNKENNLITVLKFESIAKRFKCNPYKDNKLFSNCQN